MIRFIALRLFFGVISLLALALLIFVLSRMTGDPVSLLLPANATAKEYAHLRHQLGLDQPIPRQFLTYLSGLLHGSLGTSISYQLPVTSLIGSPLVNSAKLIVPSFVLSLAIGIPFGAVAATTGRRPIRGVLGVFSAICIAAPPFWIGLMLMYIFSVKLGLLPSGFSGGFTYYVLPVGTLTLFMTAGIVRLVESSMVEAMGSEYVKLARLKGLSERRVVWIHALRNSLVTTAAYTGVYMSSLITGNIVIERVFAWPGAGAMLYDAIIDRDYPIVQGIILASGAIIVLFNLAAEIVHGYLDPRIRL